LTVLSIYRWREGTLTGQDDELVLRAAAEDGLTLVTYDLKTVPPLLAEWGAAGIAHQGVVFVDDRTIRSSNFGDLIRALVHLWDREHDRDWQDRIVFLGAS
jgi:hypothetical protein